MSPAVNASEEKSGTQANSRQPQGFEAKQRGTALFTTPRTAASARENFNISALPEDAR